MAVQHVKHFLKEMGQPVDESILKSVLYDSNKIGELDKKTQKLLSNVTCESTRAMPLPETARVELHTVTRASSPIVDGPKNDRGDGGSSSGGVETGAVVATVNNDESVQPMQED